MQDLALFHDADPVGHGHGLDLVMGDIDRRCADPVVQEPQFLAHQVPELRIECTERLVEEKCLGAAHDGAAKGDALPVAAREPVDRLLKQMVDAQHSGDLFGAPAHFLARQALDAQREGDVLAHVHVRVERE